MPDAHRYFLHNAGRVLGPYTLVQLRGMRTAGRLGANTEVSTDGRTWRLALTVPGLFADTPATAAPLEVLPAPAQAMPVSPLLQPPHAAPAPGPGFTLTNDDGPPYLPSAPGTYRRSGDSHTPLIIGLSIAGGLVLLALGGFVLITLLGGAERTTDDGLSGINRLGGERVLPDLTEPGGDRTPALPRRKLSVEEIVKQCGPSVCVVYGKVGTGSGFMVAPNLVATNYHVAEPNRSSGINLAFPSAPQGQRGPFKGRMVHGHSDKDLAFVQITTRQRPLSLPTSYRFRSGQEIIIIGSPGLGGVDVLPNAVTRGLLSTTITDGSRSLYQLDASVNPGNSGGPVLDDSGQVLGVVTARARKEERLAFCVPLDDLRAELARALAK